LSYKFDIESLSTEEKLVFFLIGSSVEKYDYALKNHVETNIVDWEGLISFCSEHGLTSILYKYLKNRTLINLLDEKKQEKLKSYYYFTIKNNVIKQEYLNKIQKQFSESNIEILPLKGSYLINNHYEDIGLRPMSDIDILIEEKNIISAKNIFFKNGYTIIPARTSIEETYGLQYNLQFAKKDSLIELHRNITPLYSRYRLNIEEFWKCKSNSNLSLENHIIHFCVHFNFNINNRLVRLGWLYDIVSIITKNNNKIDWKYISEFCIKNKLFKAVFPILYFLKNHYNIDIQIDFNTNDTVPYFDRFSYNINCVFKNGNSKIIIEKNLNYNLKLELITKWSDKIRYLLQLVFPQKTYMIHKYRKITAGSYIKELKLVLKKA